MLWKKVLSATATAAILASVRAAPQSSGTTTSVSSATCCANCCDANGHSISPTLPAGVTATGSDTTGSALPTSGAPSSIITSSALPTSGASSSVSSSGATSSTSSQSPASSGTVGNGNSTTSSGNSTTSGSSTSPALSNPYFFVYSDNWVNGCLPDPSEMEGWNVVGLSFLLSTGPADQVQCWQQLDASTRQGLISKYHAAGIKVVASVFGSTETPTTAGKDPTQLAGTFASFIQQYQLDGIDIDYEDSAAMNKRDGTAEKWLITFTQELRKQLPQGKYLLTHAPLAPWFSNAYPDAYHTVNSQAGDLIDFYNIQFYNQQDYENCDTLITQSGSQWANSAILQMIDQKFPANKLVIGKPATTADSTGGDGYIAPAMLNNCTSMAISKGWNAGVMSWQYPHANSAWIKAVRGSS